MTQIVHKWSIQIVIVIPSQFNTPPVNCQKNKQKKMSPSSSASSPSLWTRFINYITSWLSFVVEFICSLYRDELQRQSRQSDDYHRWRQHQEMMKEQEQPFMMMTTSTTPILTSSSPIGEDEENILGHYSQSSHCPLETTAILPTSESSVNNIITPTNRITTVSSPFSNSITNESVEAVKQQQQQESEIISEQSPLLKSSQKETSPQKQMTPLNKEEMIRNKTSTPPQKQQTSSVNKSNSTTPVLSKVSPNVKSSTMTKESGVTSPSEASGLIGERLKLKKTMKNKLLSQNAYNSLVKNSKQQQQQSGEESGSHSTQNTSSDALDSSEIIAQKNSQILKRKLSSKPSFTRRRPTTTQHNGQQEKKPSIEILSKLENESSIDLPSVEKFAHLEEQAQLEKKLGTETAMKQQQEKKRSDDIEVNNSKSPSSKSNTKGPQVSLAAILGAKNSLRKTQ